jgi:acyl-CoA thioester hydrolase
LSFLFSLLEGYRLEFNDTVFRVRYAETDQMGMTHHSSYIPWFEVGRTEYMRERGFPYTRLEALGLALPVIECFCRYLSPTHYDDVVVIRTFLDELTRARVGFNYEVWVETEQGRVKSAEGHTRHFFVNQKGRPIHLGLNTEVWLNLKDLKKQDSSTAKEHR